MVLQGFGEETGENPAPGSMATSPKRSKRLHNFTLPYLKWGNQRYLRCSNAGGAGGSSSGDRRSSASWSDDSSVSRRKRESEPETNHAIGSRLPRRQISGGRGVEDGIEAMREKLILDLKSKADKMKDAFLRSEEEDDENDADGKERRSTPTVAAAAAPAEGVRTWNLRTRRAECKSPFSGGVGIGGEKGWRIDEKKPVSSSPARTDGGAAAKLPKLRSNSGKAEPRQKFSIQLSKKEIEEDFMKMVGHRPPRRPNKRPRAVQKKLDTLFPGMWLTEVTTELYKVPEEQVNGGKARHSGKAKGLMHLAETESESDEEEES